MSKHITVTITALHRLTMLVSAVEQLQGMASKRQYKETAVQLEAVNQLCSHFEAYRDIPKIRELREKFKHIKQILKSHVFSYFSRELAKLDKAERRYAWIKRRLRTNKEIWKIFPPHWRVPYLLCTQFCKLTRTQLIEILNYLKEKPDVGTLLLALQRTLEFEEELAEKLGAGTRSTEKESFFYTLVKDGGKDWLATGAGFNFRGIISSCFEPHLTIYIELVEKTLMENLETLVQEETWDIEEGSQTNILSSSLQVFLIIRRSLKHCSALTKSQTFFNLLKDLGLREPTGKARLESLQKQEEKRHGSMSLQERVARKQPLAKRL